MSMREYEEAKNIVIPKEQEEMMDIICDAWEECRSLESCKDCQDRPLSTMSMMMCTALKYTRKLVEAGYTNLQAADVECCGRLRGVTYEDGKVTAVYIRDTDDMVKVFVPVRHGRWILEAHDERVNYKWNVTAECSECCDEQKEIWAGFFQNVPPSIARDAALVSAESVKLSNYCPNCGAIMDGGDE